MNEGNWYTADSHQRYELELHEHERDRLIPTNNTLLFAGMFLLACADTPPEMDCLGLYCNGGEL